MLPFFYHTNIAEELVTLDEATSKHCIQVLRMQVGDQLILVDGNGARAVAEIRNPDRKRCIVKVGSLSRELPRPFTLSLGIAFTKSNNRNEWFLEKATELGIDYILPIIAERSERDKFNQERYQQILVSAMLQSQQSFLPVLMPPKKFKFFLSEDVPKNAKRFIAHCDESSERSSFLNAMRAGDNAIVLIGPEGDFSKAEIEAAIASGFNPVTLGRNRLRTETAAIYVTTVFNAFHYG